MKIVHLIYSLTTGGTETMLVDIANEQVRTHDVSIVIINNIINDEIVKKIDSGVKVHKINRREGSKNPIPIIKLNRLLYKLKPAVIHGHNEKAIDVLLGKNRARTVLTVHNDMSSYPRYEEYKKLFAISEAVQRHLDERFRLPSAVVYNGIRLHSIRKKETTDRSASPFRIVQLGRLEHGIKGQDILIKAIRVIKDTCNANNLSVDFIGEGSSMEYLKGLTEELQLNPYINFLGLKDRTYIYEHLADYDLLVQPSLYEGFGLTVAEAMAAGVPVLVSDIDGPMEIIQGGRYGYHFPSEQVDKLAKAILEITNNPNLHTKAIEARQYALSHFSIEETARNYINEYKKLKQ